MKPQIKRVKIDSKDAKVAKRLHESVERKEALKNHVKSGMPLKTFHVNK